MNTAQELIEIYNKIIVDSSYIKNIAWGEPRPGHDEGTVEAHIAEISENLEHFKPLLSVIEYWKLKIILHTHDSFKAESESGVAILHPKSHASLAVAFTQQYLQDSDILNMIQYHDEPYALWRQFKQKGSYNTQRFESLLAAIQDWDLFSLFNIIDTCTKGKSREGLYWFYGELKGKLTLRFDERHIID